MTWAICYADRELARMLGDPDLGYVRASSQEEAIQKAEANPEISRKRFPHATLWAYAKANQS